MKKNPSPKLGLRISSETSNGYKHLSFQLLKRKEYSETDMEEMFVIRFQSDSENKGWYAMRTTVETSGNAVNHLSDALKLIKKLTPENQYDETPETILAKCAELKIARVEYDSRLSQFVTEKDCPDVSLTRWMDGYMHYNRNYGCTVATLARDENDARNKIAKEFAENVAQGHSLETFEKWIAAGKPVEQNRGSIYDAARFAPIESVMEPLNK
jgi:hypothetical protein